MYKLYLEDTEIDYIPDTYMTLNRQVNKKLIHYANLNSKALQSEFAGVKIKGMETDIISSFEICSADFVKISKIVNENSDRMKRMFLNAVYSKIFRVAISDDIVLSSYDKKGLTYGELRLLVFLRNQNCNVDKLLNWDMDLSDSENMQNIDYTIFEVLSAYKKYVNLPENIDNFIRVHKYTCDVWKMVLNIYIFIHCIIKNMR